MELQRNEFNLNNFEIEISDSAYAILDKSWKCDNVCDPFSRLYFVKKGTGFLKFGKKTVELRAGFVYLIPSELTFSYGCFEHIEKLFFHISLAKTEKYDLLATVKTICKLPFSDKELNELKSLYFSENYIDKLTLKMLLYKTLSEFTKKHNFKAVPIKSYSEPVKKTMTYIQRHTKINLSVKEISKNLYISESKIRKAFKDELGATVGEYIDDLVFIKAKKMLGKNNASIGEISEALGFCDQFYFSRRFKEKFGKAPSKYRKEAIFFKKA